MRHQGVAHNGLDLEEKAIAAYKRAIDAIRECHVAYENARIAVPDRVLRFLGDPDAVVSDGSGIAIPQAPPSPQRPPEVRPSWLWLPVDRVTPTTLARAILRREGRALKPADIAAEANALRSKPVSRGVLANIGTRLDSEGRIARTSDGWELREPDAAVLYEGHLWGPREAFDSYDLAEHRRMGIVHLLETSPGGLQVMQIARTLERCDWIHAPCSKDLVKTDLQTLDDEGRAKRVGNSGKWRT